MKLSTLLFLTTLFFFTACRQNASVPAKNEDMPLSSKKEIRSFNSEYFQSFFKQESELTAMQHIKHAFDEGLKGTSKNRDLPYLYKDHANRMRLDYFNKYPYTLNYPYNGKFDLSQVKQDVPSLKFLTKKCGFQVEEGDEIIHYHCFKKESNFMDFMQTLGKDNSLIANLYKDYTTQMSITQNARQLLLINSSEELDFQKEEHQLVYMFYQILINEERLAAEKIK